MMQARQSVRNGGAQRMWLRLVTSLTIGLMALTATLAQNRPDIVLIVLFHFGSGC